MIGTFDKFKGLGVASDKRTYGPDYCVDTSNVFIDNGMIVNRKGHHALATQSRTMSNAVGIKQFQPSTSLVSFVVTIGNGSTGKVAASIYRERRYPGRA